MFIENFNLSMDAGQRSVMMEAYLALIRKGAIEASGEERKLVLTALFRPTANSGSDDTPPSTVLELISKAADPKK